MKKAKRTLATWATILGLATSFPSVSKAQERVPEYMQTYTQDGYVLNPATSIKPSKAKLKASPIKGNLNRYTPTNNISSYVKSEASIADEATASVGAGLNLNNYYLSGAYLSGENNGLTLRTGKNDSRLDLQAGFDYVIKDVDEAYQIVLSVKHKPETLSWLNETASLHLGDVNGVEAEVAARLFENIFGIDNLSLEALAGGFSLETDTKEAKGFSGGARLNYAARKNIDAFIQAIYISDKNLLNSNSQLALGLTVNFGRPTKEIRYFTLNGLNNLFSVEPEKPVIPITPITSVRPNKPNPKPNPQPQEDEITGGDDDGGSDANIPTDSTNITGGDNEGASDASGNTEITGGDIDQHEGD